MKRYVHVILVLAALASFATYIPALCSGEVYGVREYSSPGFSVR
jgi:hypothetical protein